MNVTHSSTRFYFIKTIKLKKLKYKWRGAYIYYNGYK